MSVVSLFFLYGAKSYECQHAQDLWFESDDFLELARLNDFLKWGGLIVE